MSFRRLYGRGFGHLVAMVVCFGFAAYAFASIFANAAPWSVLLWLALGVVLHDFVLFPVYTGALWLLARAAGATPRRRARVRLVQHIAAPLALSALLLFTWLPLILRLSEGSYRPTTGMTQEPYLWRWLGVTAALLLGSALLALLRRRRVAPEPSGEAGAEA